MPNWGAPSSLSPSAPRPWGIPHDLLQPGKTLTDPVHGDIYLNKLEAMLVDSPPMQRLDEVMQLGTTHLIYRGATHTRLSHSLGTLRAAQDLLDAVWNSRNNPQARAFHRHLMADWDSEGKLDNKFAEATVLARLGGLLHDLCHIPLGHTIEDDLGVLEPHDKGRGRFDRLWTQMSPEIQEAIPEDSELKHELERLILSKNDEVLAYETRYPFVADIVGNTICADLMDYLRRDHLYTGLPLALGRRFMDSFFVVEDDHPYYAGHMVIGIERDGRLRNDVITELLKYLRYRYELTERALTHHAKTAGDAMLGKILETWRDHVWYEVAARNLDDGFPLDSSRYRTETIEQVRTALGASAVELLAKIDAEVSFLIETEFLSRSDADIIGHIERLGQGDVPARLKRAGDLAFRLRRRQLHKVIGLASGEVNRANAKRVYKKFRDADIRRALEREAIEFAGLPPETDVVVWVPNDNMRLKVADVLVRRGDTVAPLSDIEPKSMEIAEQHQKLWGVSVYAAGIAPHSREAAMIVAYVAQKTTLSFHRSDGSAVPNCTDLAIEAVVSELHPIPELDVALRQLPTVRNLMSAASTPDDPMTFEVLKHMVLNEGIEAKLIPEPTH